MIIISIRLEANGTTRLFDQKYMFRPTINARTAPVKPVAATALKNGNASVSNAPTRISWTVSIPRL